MAKAFLSFSHSYQPVMETVRRTLEALEFQVDVFDGPDGERPPAQAFQQRIADADCIVVLLGPSHRSQPGETVEPASWPAEEAVWAAAREKPLPMALILHAGTRVPDLIRNLQTPAKLDFWSETDFLKNLHHVLRHLLDLKRRVDLPLGDHPCIYTRAIIRNRIQRSGSLLVDAYHEVVARQECPRFHHALDAGMDHRKAAVVQLVSPEAYDVQATVNPGRHAVSVEFLSNSETEIPYFINVDPPLQPGERLGYRREFELNCLYPLKKAELTRIADEPGFPALYRQDGRVYYGDVYDVVYDMESITVAIHFPAKVGIQAKRAFAFSTISKTMNLLETERCNSAECLSLMESPDSPEKVLSLSVRRPLINHQYVLLYEPN